MDLLKGYLNNDLNDNDIRSAIYYLREIEIQSVLNSLHIIKARVQAIGGNFDRDPVKDARELRIAGKKLEAFKLIKPILKNNPNDEDAKLIFCWIMYDFIKDAENNKTDVNLDGYIKNLRILNDNVTINFHRTNSKNAMKTFVEKMLWSLRRVALKEKSNADKLLPEFIRFYRGSWSMADFSLNISEPSVSRLFIKTMIDNLNDSNYFIFMNTIGFNWFSLKDNHETKYTDQKSGDVKTIKPFKESILNSHSKKLLNTKKLVNLNEEISSFIPILDEAICKNPGFSWLPYYKGKLLMTIGKREEAFNIITFFARNTNQEFWIWNILSDLVDGQDKFNCLCAGILCKAKPEMLIGIQEKLIPLFLERKLYGDAKREVNAISSSRRKAKLKDSLKVDMWKKETWYLEAKELKTRDHLVKYAEQTQTILMKNVPLTDIYISFINEEKNTIHFIYVTSNGSMKQGYFHKNHANKEINWSINTMFKSKIQKHSKNNELYTLFEVENGDSEKLETFLQKDGGYISKREENKFAFVNEDIFIPPLVVVQNKLEDDDQIQFIKQRNFNKKKNRWGWSVIEIISVNEDIID